MSLYSKDMGCCPCGILGIQCSLTPHTYVCRTRQLLASTLLRQKQVRWCYQIDQDLIRCRNLPPSKWLRRKLYIIILFKKKNKCKREEKETFPLFTYLSSSTRYLVDLIYFINIFNRLSQGNINTKSFYSIYLYFYSIYLVSIVSTYA